MPIGADTAKPGGLIDRWAGVIARLSNVIAAVLLLGMFALINLEVVMRYVANSSTLLADEYAGYMFAALVFLGLNHAIHSEQLITIDLTGRWGALMDAPIMRFIRACLILGLNVALLYAATLTFMMNVRFQSRSIQYSKTLLAYPQSLVVIGLALACLAAIALMLRAGKPRA